MILILILLVSFPAGVPGFPLDSLFARGYSCINISWTPDSVNTRPDWYLRYGATCDSAYKHCDFLPGRNYRSIAYSYGGDDPYRLFRTRLEAGFLAGSHLCHYEAYGDPSDTVTGIDCSAFVCYLWNEPRVSTAGLVSRYPQIQKSELSPGDALVKSNSHSVVVAERNGNDLLIWESTSAVNGCRERIISLADSYWDTYVAVRDTALVSNEGKEMLPGGALDATLSLYPLPFRETLNFRFQNAIFSRLGVYDINGRSIAVLAVLDQQDRITWRPPKTLSCGVYLVRAEARNGLTVRKCAALVR